MPNLSALEPLTTKVQALANLVMVSPQFTVGYQPQNPDTAEGVESSQQQQPPALLFHYEGEQTIILESDITDHYVEDNTAVQDQIALKPEIIQTEGFIGELNDVVPTLLAPLKFAADKLTAVAAFEPSLSVSALLAYQEAFFLYQVAASAANAAVSTWNTIGNIITGDNGQTVVGDDGILVGSSQNKQQVMFQQFCGYWRQRVLFTVQTPWAVFQNMAIQRVQPIQSEETDMISSFKVSFKRIRKVSSITQESVANIFQGRSASQASSLVDLGTSSPTQQPLSLGSALSTMGVA